MDPRTLWTLAEPLHALTYFAPEAHRAFEDAGVRGFWRGYFAGRAAPLGVVPASVVTATFFGFQPEFVARAIPSIWSMTTPEDAIVARLEGVDRALARIGSDAVPVRDADRAVAAVREAAAGTSVAGRPLFAANLSLEWPASPRLALWHAATVLREHRGDGHVAALVSADVGPCAAHVLRIADDGLPLDSIRPYRGWSDDDWAGAADRLRERELLDERGRITTSGAALRRGLEDATDAASAALVLEIDDLESVADAFGAVATRIAEAGDVPYPNPIGVPPPITPG